MDQMISQWIKILLSAGYTYETMSRVFSLAAEKVEYYRHLEMEAQQKQLNQVLTTLEVKPITANKN